MSQPRQVLLLTAYLLGSLLLAGAVSNLKISESSIDCPFWGVVGFLLLSSHRVFRQVTIVTVALAATYLGISQIFTYVKEPPQLDPGVVAICVAVILAWTLLVAVCIGRLIGSRDDD